MCGEIVSDNHCPYSLPYQIPSHLHPAGDGKLVKAPAVRRRVYRKVTGLLMMGILHMLRWQRGEKDCWMSGGLNLSELHNVGPSCWGSLPPGLSPSLDLCCSCAFRCCGGCGSDGGFDVSRGLPSESLNCPVCTLCHPCLPDGQNDANGMIWRRKSLYPVGSGKMNDGSLFHLHIDQLSLCPYPCLFPGVPVLCLSLYRKAAAAHTVILEVA